MENKAKSHRMTHLHRILSTLLFVCISLAEEMPPTRRVFQLYHSSRFGDNDKDSFLLRGSITLTPSPTGDLSVKFSEEDMPSSYPREDFDYLVRSGGLYRIKLVDVEDSSHSIIVSTNACDVRRAHFR